MKLITGDDASLNFLNLKLIAEFNPFPKFPFNDGSSFRIIKTNKSVSKFCIASVYCFTLFYDFTNVFGCIEKITKKLAVIIRFRDKFL